MLARLSIRDVVLIERLDLTFGKGLGVLTGETGAGKSILLDSLGLALGERADSSLVRQGADALSVSAVFELSSDHPAMLFLAEQGWVPEETLILRRTVTRDGRSRAFVNDQPASVGLLRTVGGFLVEVHGQFESHGLLNPATHRDVLDLYGTMADQVVRCREAWQMWQVVVKARVQAEADLKAVRAEEEILQQDVEALSALAPRAGEEAVLAERRQRLMQGEKIAEALQGAVDSLETGGGVEVLLRAAGRHLDRIASSSADRTMVAAMDALERAAIEAAEARSLLEKAAGDVDLDPRTLERVEDRLFALRGAARRHACSVDALADVLAGLRGRLEMLNDGEARVVTLLGEEQGCRQAYLDAARALSMVRRKVAAALDQAVAGELPPLKLDRARFVTQVEEMPEGQWGPEGMDRVAFEVATNPGAVPGPVGKIASGGELARFMLALKVVLARTSRVPTLVFDEVDAGIGGATAAAVGDRLVRLARDVQVLVVTHSPQVAAKGDRHWRVAKHSEKETVVTTVESLDAAARREEVARMLAGETVTAEARAAAASLLG